MGAILPKTPKPDVHAKRLKDRVRPPVEILFVGINPGIRSALTGHHFAGYTNRFWRLLWQSRIVPQPVRPEDDVRLPEWECAITNLVPRPTAGISELRPSEYSAGERILRRKVRKWRPRIVALVGVTLYRALFKPRAGTTVRLGFQPELLEGRPVFVLPNPSGRNANFSFHEMLTAFKALKRHCLKEAKLNPGRSGGTIRRVRHRPDRGPEHGGAAAEPQDQ
jgi:TDG/mug DNA glycosylase family protein